MRIGCWLVGFFGLAFVVACGAVIPSLPSKGGPAWIEVKSPHFTLWTDTSAGRGQVLVREMERRRQVIMTAMSSAPSEESSFVIALANKREMKAYLEDDRIATSWNANNPTFQPGILLIATGEDGDHIVSHELAHVISYVSIRNQSSWFAEGLAGYFEMVDLDHGDAEVQIGMPRDDRSDLLRRSGPTPVAELFSCQGNRCTDGRYFATSWLLFSWLLNERYEQLGRYLKYLNEHSRNNPADAWLAVFPELTPTELDANLRIWIRSGKLRLPRIAVTAQAVQSTTRPLDDADILAVRSMLLLRLKGDKAAAQALSETALGLDSTNLLAQLIETRLTQRISPDAARATAAAHPADWRAWHLVAFALGNRPEGKAAHERMCTLSGDTALDCRHDDAPKSASR